MPRSTVVIPTPEQIEAFGQRVDLSITTLTSNLFGVLIQMGTPPSGSLEGPTPFVIEKWKVLKNDQAGQDMIGNFMKWFYPSHSLSAEALLRRQGVSPILDFTELLSQFRTEVLASPNITLTQVQNIYANGIKGTRKYLAAKVNPTGNLDGIIGFTGNEF